MDYLFNKGKTNFSIERIAYTLGWLPLGISYNYQKFKILFKTEDYCKALSEGPYSLPAFHRQSILSSLKLF